MRPGGRSRGGSAKRPFEIPIHLVKRLGERHERVIHNAITTLTTMHEVTRRLVPQIVQWITTGVVAKGKIVHAGLTQARAIVRNKVGKKVEYPLL